MTRNKVRRFYCRSNPKWTLPYAIPTKEALRKYPCCNDATVTKGLRTLIQDDETFAFQKLLDGIESRRQRLYKMDLPVGENRIAELLQAGFIIDTVPSGKVSLRTVERRRKQASDFCKVFGKLRLKEFTEDYLWALHAACATGCSVFNKVQIKLEIKDAKAIRKGIHDFVKRESRTTAWILQSYDWGWQRHPLLKLAPKSTRRLAGFLQKQLHHPKTIDYLPFFGDQHV